MTGSGDVLEFAGFRLDLRRMGVWKEGQPVALEPKALDVLHYLVVHRDRLVTKDELLDAVWKDTFVTPNALTRVVAQLRKGLGDDVENPRLIETVAKRGYRFVAPVVVPPGELVAASELPDRAAGSGIGEAPAPETAPAPATPTLAPAASTAKPAGTATARLGALAAIAVLVAAAATFFWTRPAGSRADHASVPEITAVTSFGDVIDAIIAPDGKYIAYIRSSAGKQSLWVRQLKGTNAIELLPPAAVSYYGMTFAPDSGSIYYVVRGPEPLAYPTGMLFNIPTLGGLPRRLGTPFDHRPSVSPDGRQLASLRSDFPAPGQSALLITDADGGHARTLLVKDEPEILAPGFFVAPSWSPSGDRIAVAVRNEQRHTARLLTVDTSSGAEHVFDKTFSIATFTSWLPDGSGIVLLASDTHDPSEFASRLWFQPLPSGAPRQLTTGLVGYRNATVTADGQWLLSVGSVSNASLWATPLDGREPPRKIPSMKEDGLGGVAWLDRDSLVFTSSDGGSVELWTMKPDGSARRQLTAGGWNAWPRPTRDGQTIYFVTDAGSRQGIWRMNRDGTDPRPIASGVDASELALTPDERTLVFTAIGPDRVASTWSVAAEGGAPKLLARGVTRPAVSPDGRFIAGILSEGPASTPLLVVVPSGGGTPVKTFAVTGNNAGSGGMWWTRDGASILYSSAGGTNVWRQPLSGGPPLETTAFADGAVVRGDLSADGSALLLCRTFTLRDAFLITGFK